MKLKHTILANFIFFILLLSFFSCEKDKLEGNIVSDSEVIEYLYNKSSDSVKIDNQILILETDIYRNLTPGGPIPDNHRRLIAPIWIVNIDSVLISNNLTITNLYILNQGQVWISQPEINTENYTPEFKTYAISKNGPEWETNIYVDAVISFIDLSNNEEKYLIARDQIIIKVE